MFLLVLAFVSVFLFFSCCVIWASLTDCSLQSRIFLLFHLPRLCQSCWRWCVSPSSTRPTCWTWWTTRSWSSRRRRAAIWWTRPSATTCCPTRGKRCRRPGLGRGSPPVNTTHTQQRKINWCASSLARMTPEHSDLHTYQCTWPRTTFTASTHPHTHRTFILYRNEKKAERWRLHEETLTRYWIVLILVHNWKAMI